MKTRTKVIFSALLVALLSLIVVLSVALIFAATNQTITSSISVTYTSKEVVGTATARWCEYTEESYSTWDSWNNMEDSDGNTEIRFDLEELTGASLSPNQELTIEKLNDYVALEYYFTNEGTKPYELRLTYQDDDVEDKNIVLRTMVGPMTEGVANSWIFGTSPFVDYLESNFFENFTGEINTVVMPDSQTAIYILVEIENWGADASFSGTMNFELDGTAIEEYIDNFLYYSNGETATLTGVAKGNPEDVDGINFFVSDEISELNVPTTSYDGFPVKTIGPFAFFCQSNLTSIASFGNVENIGFCAYEESGLTGHLTIPSTVKNVLGGFLGCRDITSLTLQNGIENIGQGAFESCDFSKVTIPNSVKYIGNFALDGNNLTDVLIPSSVINIGKNPFRNCEQLTKIVVDSGNTNFTSRNLTNTECNVIIDKTTKTLISGCNNSTIPQDGSITKIGDSAFNNVGLSGQLIIPSSVRQIGVWAFSNCRFTSVIIPSSVEQIGFGAFSSCGNLTNVTIDSKAVCDNLIEWEKDDSWPNITETDLIDYATTIKAKYEIVGIESYSRKFTRSQSQDSNGYWTYTYTK